MVVTLRQGAGPAGPVDPVWRKRVPRGRRRSKRVLAVVAILAIAVALVLLAAHRIGLARGAGPSAPVIATVVVGDTLWDIAQVHTPTGMDIRERIFQIRRANALTDVNLVPGQILIVPAAR